MAWKAEAVRVLCAHKEHVCGVLAQAAHYVDLLGNRV